MKIEQENNYSISTDHSIKPDVINSIVFSGNNQEEILRLSKDGFFYKGERVDDIHNVYERFNDWLNLTKK